jgi:hypothetical protein
MVRYSVYVQSRIAGNRYTPLIQAAMRRKKRCANLSGLRSYMNDSMKKVKKQGNGQPLTRTEANHGGSPRKRIPSQTHTDKRMKKKFSREDAKTQRNSKSIRIL